MAKKAVKKAGTKKTKSAKSKSSKAKASKPEHAKAKSVKSKKTAKAKPTKTAKKSSKPRTRRASAGTPRAKSGPEPLSVLSTGAGAKLAGKVGSSAAVIEQAAVRKRTRKASPLSPQELEEFRNMLLRQRGQLSGSVAQMRTEALKKNRQEAAGDLSKFPTSPADLGSDNFELEFTLSMLENEGELLKEIDEALGRIQRGVYGICEATGESIPRTRLEYEPWARYTVEHTTRLEKKTVRAQPEPEQ